MSSLHPISRKLAPALVGVPLLLAACGVGTHLPAGTWGRVIGCLQDHPTLSVSAAGNDSNITGGTNAVVVLSQLHGTLVAYAGNNALGADDITGAEAIAVDEAAGPIHYGFDTHASDTEKLAVSDCINAGYPASARRAGTTTTGSYAGTRACAGELTAGPHTSCSFAAAVFQAYNLAAYPVRTVSAYSSLTHRRYLMRCVGEANTMERCTGAEHASVTFSVCKINSGCGRDKRAPMTTAKAPPSCPGDESAGAAPSVYGCYLNPNQCIKLPQEMSGTTGPGCPADEMTRGQAVYEQGCYGLSEDGSVAWTAECPDPPGSGDLLTFGLPCEQLLNESTDSELGPYVAFYAGSTRATYAPNSVGAFNPWTPACLKKQS